MYFRHGVLLVMESYHGRVNNAGLCYNWRPNTLQGCHEHTSSGGWNLDLYNQGVYVWGGHHDVRTGLRYYLSDLANNGEFLDQWVEPVHVWLVHWMEKYQKDGNEQEFGPGGYYNRIINERFERLPEYARKAVKIVKG